MQADRADRRRQDWHLALLPILLGLSVTITTGCQTGYVIQQGLGQLKLTWNRVRLEDADLAGSLDDATRRKLSWVPRIVAFARDELGLDPGDSYTTFLDTKGAPITHETAKPK